jgi:pectin methylesterase-like acyl-CoA thioesterase
MEMHRTALGGVLLAMVVTAGQPVMAQDTLVGLGAVRGYTDVVFDTTAERYDILVDASRPEDPAHGRYQTIQAAYAAAPAGTRERPTVIGLMPDVYQLRGTETDTGLSITKANITLLGLTRDRRNVVLADNRGNKQGAANNGFSMMVDADGFSAINLTILNYCNLDYDYPGDPSKSLKKRSGVITQAVAIQMQGDRHVYSHVAILSRLDTMFNRTKRSWFTHAYLEGTDDYLGAPGGSVWEDSEINFIEGGGILFAGGTTFIRTRFRATKPMTFYKVPVAPVALIESTLPDQPVAWFGWRAPDHFPEYSLTWRTTTDDGRPVDIVDSLVGEPRRTLTHELTDQEVLAFNPWNLLRWTPDGVDDGWDPAGARARFESQAPLPFRIKLTNGVSRIRTAETPVEVTAAVFPPVGTTRVRWTTASPLVRLSVAEGGHVTVTAANETDRTETVAVQATADNGFASTAWITVDPAYRPAPTLVADPAPRPTATGLRLDYDLSLPAGREDRSLVTWFACAADATCAAPKEIAVSRGDAPLKALAVSGGLAGQYVMATIEPAHDLSRPGPARSSEPVLAPVEARTASAATDLRSLPDSTVANRWEGDWKLTGAWASEAPIEADDPWGFRVGGEDSALLYVGHPEAGDMDVTVEMDTDKYEGQGFAIPGRPDDVVGPDGKKGPYAEVLFKYDPVTRTGYSLRFWRTTRSATAVVFQLYRIVDGHGTPMGEDRLTGVVKPTTTLRIRVRGNAVTATGANTTDGETLDLTGMIEPNGFGGAGFFWTASRPSGSVVLRGVQVGYP